MSDLESKPAFPAAETVPAHQALQKQLNIILLAVIVLSGAFAGFLWQQVRHTKSDLENMKPMASAIMQGYSQEKPMLDAFVGKVAEYAKTHPDFAPVAQKYQLNQPGRPLPAPAPATAPAPAVGGPAAPAKK